jgi:hypothetical protein
MLQIDHIYEFLYQEIFNKNFSIYFPNDGIVPPNNNLSLQNFNLFTKKEHQHKIFFVDQEPIIPNIIENYIKFFKFPSGISLEELYQKILNGDNQLNDPLALMSYEEHLENLANPNQIYKEPHIFVTSEISDYCESIAKDYNMILFYYFFHGFAAQDWYRGHYALNYNTSIIKEYKHDFITFNRIINNDRSYRIYFVSLLKEQGLLDHGQVSFNVTDNLFDDWQDETADPNSKLSADARQHIEHQLTDISKLIIDKPELPGSASADIPRDVDAFWHIVTETVFYYDKLHLTEKIFKPIVSKQPFMLLAAPGNLAYLKSYGFKTFDSVIDESYDNIQDPDLRIQAVVRQLHWYCNLTLGEKTDVIQQLEPIIQHNFDHFYGEFRHIITRELLDNTKTLFQNIGYDDSHINYTSIHHILTH